MLETRMVAGFQTNYEKLGKYRCHYSTSYYAYTDAIISYPSFSLY